MKWFKFDKDFKALRNLGNQKVYLFKKRPDKKIFRLFTFDERTNEFTDIRDINNLLEAESYIQNELKKYFKKKKNSSGWN
jgi:hypothetical protein